MADAMRLADATQHLRAQGWRVTVRPTLGVDGFVPDYALHGHGRHVAVIYAATPPAADELLAFARRSKEVAHEPWLVGPESRPLRDAATHAGLHFEPMTATVLTEAPPAIQPTYRVRGQEPRRWLWVLLLWAVALSFVGWSLARVV